MLYDMCMRTTLFMKIVAAALLLASLSAAQTSPPATTAPAASQPHHDPVKFTPIPHVEVRGTGPIAMVLIPGMSCDWTVFDAFMTRNASRFTMYAVTLPGFGESEPPPKPPEGQFGAWLDNAAAAVWKVVEEKKLEKPVIAGHSLGGHLALRIGAEHPDQVRAVISIDGGPAFPMLPTAWTLAQRHDIARQVFESAKNMHEDEWVTNQWKFIMNMVTDENRGIELAKICVKVPPGVTVQYMADLYSADIREQLPSLHAPVLVMASAPVFNPASIKMTRKTWTELLQGVPKLSFALFENTRHFIQDDRPAEMDAAIEDFLAGREVKGYTVQVESQPVTTSPTTRPS